MIFGIIKFTYLHTMLSVVGIIAGLVLAGAWMAGKHREGWSRVFLVTTILTSVTGFGFPFTTILPAHVVGAISLVILPLALFARYAKGMAGAWRRPFLIASIVALYLNVFVLMAQLFKRLPTLFALAPTQQEPTFAVTQLLILVGFVLIGRQVVQGMREG